MDDPSPDVVRAAITRLIEIEGARAAPRLRARLLSADLSVTADVARALRGLGDGGALQVAIDGLAAEQPSIRLAAVRALGALGDEAAAVGLRAALRIRLPGCVPRRSGHWCMSE
jgi:HEAT repeat protein